LVISPWAKIGLDHPRYVLLSSFISALFPFIYFPFFRFDRCVYILNYDPRNDTYFILFFGVPGPFQNELRSWISSNSSHLLGLRLCVHNSSAVVVTYSSDQHSSISSSPTRTFPARKCHLPWSTTTVSLGVYIVSISDTLPP